MIRAKLLPNRDIINADVDGDKETSIDRVNTFRGEKGEKGDKGDKGEPFTFSDFTPEQLEALRGPQGLQGPKGDSVVGPQGPQGIQGPKGDTGSVGPTGEKGEPFRYSDFTPAQLEALRGPEGKQGPQGESIVGPKGPQGEKGPKGDKGDSVTGPQGPQGPKGDTPVKGVDYFTPAEVEALEETIKHDIHAVTKVSELENDSGFISTESDPTVPAWAKAAEKPTYTAAEVGALPADTHIPADVTDDHINALIDAKLGVIENGSY